MASAITELAHLQIPLQKVLDATNNFSDKNIIGKGDFGKVYRGKLEHDGKVIKIAARRLDRKYGHGDVEFWTEVSMLSSFPRNYQIVAMIGFCDEKDEKIVINHHYPKGSLSRYISDPLTLNVKERLTIAWLLCWGIFNIHTKLESDYIIHRNINSSTVLLDEKWKPMLSGFEFSIKHSKELRNQVVISEAIGTQGYIDPAIEKYGGVNHKSDIYSVGVVLFELLCGRKAFEENRLLAPLAKFHYEKGTLKDIIHPDIWNQMNPKSFKCFSKAAYSCLQEDPTLRPEARKLWRQLMKANGLQQKEDEMEDEEDDMQREKHPIQREKHPIYENVPDTISPDQVKKWEHLRIGLTQTYPCSRSHSRKMLSPYLRDHEHLIVKMDIEYYDREHVSFVEQKNTNEVPKKHQAVMTKKVDYKEDVFLREIEILDSCSHPNIQSIVGFYEIGHEMLIFYEYFSNNHLYRSLNDTTLNWGKRLKICIDVAHGLDYLHNGMEDQKMVIHGDLNSAKIMLDANLGAKIVGFENSVIFHSNQSDDSIQLNGSIWNLHYMDPEYVNTGKLTKESDVFSFGVIMFEILCGRPGFVVIRYEGKKNEGMASLARQWFDEGTIKKKLATGIKEENYGNSLFLNKGPNEDSLDTFINIAYKCLAVSQMQRPEIKVVIKELHKALSFHENHKDPLRMSFNDIKLATQDFDRANCIGGGGFGLVYKGKLAHGKVNGNTTIVVKKLDTSQGQGEKQYYNELRILYEYNHDNVISLIGYSNETDEKLIVYEHAPKGSLEKHLNNASLTWIDRLKICIDVATGLNFLHEGIQGQRVVIHRDIKAANILLFDDWKAKVGDFGLSLIIQMKVETKFTIDHPCGTKDYVDPMYLKSGILTVESDVYSFGVALFEILSGRATYTLPKHERQSLLSFIKDKFENKKQNELVFEAISEEIVPRSLTTFLNIVFRCLNDDREIRPTTRLVLTELKKALELQEYHKDPLKMSFNDIKLATQDFDRANCIGGGGFRLVYKGKLAHGEVHGHSTIVVKKFDTSQGQGEKQYYNELQILSKNNHENVISLIGYSNETDEKLIVYEHASKGSLNNHLNNASLTWRDRLKICIDVATGLNFLHEGIQGQWVVIHRDIKTANILLFDDWKAKVSDFGLSLIITTNEETKFTIDHPCGTKDYVDPMYLKSGILTVESDVYSFGVALFEILSGRATYTLPEHERQSLLNFIIQKIFSQKKDEFVFKAMKEEIVPKSFSTFLNIVYKCLDDDREKRPTMKEVLAQLEKALKFQDEYKI